MAARGGPRSPSGGSIIATIFFIIFIAIAILMFVSFLSALPRGLGVESLIAIIVFIFAMLIIAYIICIAIDLLSHSTILE